MRYPGHGLGINREGRVCACQREQYYCLDECRIVEVATDGSCLMHSSRGCRRAGTWSDCMRGVYTHVHVRDHVCAAFWARCSRQVTVIPPHTVCKMKV